MLKFFGLHFWRNKINHFLFMLTNKTPSPEDQINTDTLVCTKSNIHSSPRVYEQRRLEESLSGQPGCAEDWGQSAESSQLQKHEKIKETKDQLAANNWASGKDTPNLPSCPWATECAPGPQPLGAVTHAGVGLSDAGVPSHFCSCKESLPSYSYK